MTLLHLIARIRQQDGTVWNFVLLKFATLRIKHADFSGLAQSDSVWNCCSGDFRFAAIDILDRSSLRDLPLIFRCGTDGDSTCVESTHRQLSSRLADGLRCNDSHCKTFFNQLAGGHIHSVAGCANAARSLAGEWASHIDSSYAEIFDESSLLNSDDFIARNDRSVRSWIDDVLATCTALEHVTQRNIDFFAFVNSFLGDATSLLAIVLDHNDGLCNVAQFSREIARICSLERSIGKTLTRTVCRGEILDDGQSFAEVRLDRCFHDLATRLRHLSAHAGQLLHLSFVSSSTRVHEQEHGVEVSSRWACGRRGSWNISSDMLRSSNLISSIGLERFQHHRRKSVATLGPSIHHAISSFVIGGVAVVIILTSLIDLLLTFSDQFFLVFWNVQIGDAE